MEYETKEYRGYKIHITYDNFAEDPREWDNIATFVCEHRKYKMGDEHSIEDMANELFDSYVSSKVIIEHFVTSRHAVLKYDDIKDEYFYEWKDHEEWCYIPLRDIEDADKIAQDVSDELSSAEKLNLVWYSDEVEIQRISMYDHSGVSVWLGDNNSRPCDQWDCGTLGFAYITKATAKEEMLNFSENTWKKWAKKRMECEMNIWSAYVSGETYAFDIEKPDGDDLGDYYSGYYGEEGLELLTEEAQTIIDQAINDTTTKREQVVEFLDKHIEAFCNLRFIDDNKLYDFHHISGMGPGDVLPSVSKINNNGIIEKPEMMFYNKLSDHAIYLLYKHYTQSNK